MRPMRAMEAVAHATRRFVPFVTFVLTCTLAGLASLRGVDYSPLDV